MTTLVVLGVIGAIVLYAISLYNRLVKERQMVAEGWSGIDVQLKRRADLIPNLVNSVKGYLTHEKDVLTKVTEMRAQAVAAQNAGPEDRARAETALGQALVNLKAVMENYPDLKANQNVLELQDALDKIENDIQLSRRYYNGAVRNLNVDVEQFPSNLIANQFKFQKAEYFEIEDAADRAVPQVELQG